MPGYNIQIEKLCRKIKIGDIIGTPCQIQGGLLHRMYDVNTTTGRFAVKALNPVIMERKDTYNNYVLSEKIAYELSHVIEASHANIYNGTYVQELEGQYYLIYDFKEGKPLEQGEISPEHAYGIGAVVAKIHGTDFSHLKIQNDNTVKAREFDWRLFLDMGKERNAEWHGLLNGIRDRLAYIAEKMNEAYAALSTNETICHGDLDPKNVLWDSGTPVIIDWESAWYYNPQHDFLETALYWSRNEDLSIDYGRFSAFAKGYASIRPIAHHDWQTVLYSGYSAKLGWLEYSLKRSLGIECNDPAEQKLGTWQVGPTIDDILQYEKHIPGIIDFINANLCLSEFIP